MAERSQVERVIDRLIPRLVDAVFHDGDIPITGTFVVRYSCRRVKYPYRPLQASAFRAGHDFHVDYAWDGQEKDARGRRIFRPVGV